MYKTADLKPDHAAQELLIGLRALFVLVRQRLLPGDLLLRLLVPVLDQLVQEATRLSFIMALLFGLFDFSGKMACCLVVDIVFVLDLVEIGCEVSGRLFSYNWV
jgi:hypothetical protein